MLPVRNRGGFTLIEMVIAMSLFMILLAPLFGVFVVSNQSAHYDESVTDTQAKTRSSLELVTRQVRKIVRINTALDDTPGRSRIEFATIEDLGAADSWIPATWLLADFDKNWDPNIWMGATVRIIYGKGAGQERPILANSTNYLVLNGAWTETPDNTSVYEILVDQELYVDDAQVPPALIYSRILWDSGSGTPVFNPQPFGRNITGFTLIGYDESGNRTTAADGITALDIQVAAQSETARKGVAPDAPDAYFEYSVSNRVKLRNTVITVPEVTP